MLRLSEEDFARINGERLKPKRLKFGNKKTVQDGMAFDSKGEAGRFQELQLLEKAGEIFDLRRQVLFDLVVENVLICKYTADFQYRTKGDSLTVEDWKSPQTRATQAWRMVKKLMKAIHYVDIQERTAQD